MTTPKNRPELTEEQLAAAREALGRPGFDDVIAALPPELRRIVEQAKGALASSDPVAAFESIAKEAAADPVLDPSAIEAAVATALASAMAGLAGAADSLADAEEGARILREGIVPDLSQSAALPTDGEAAAAAAAVTKILDRLRDYDIQALLGPILGDIRALEADLRAIPGRISMMRADPETARQHIATLEERALRLEAASAELGGSDLLVALAGAVQDAEALLAALEQASPQMALTRGALLARSGDRAGSQQAFAVALDLAEAQGVLDVGATAATAIQLDLLQRNDLRSAMAIARRVTALADKAGDRRKVILSRYDEGLLLARTGSASEGEAIVIDTLDEARALARQDLIARGLVVLGKIREGEGDEAGALRIYEGLLANEGVEGLESEVAQGAMGVLRLIDTDALTTPLRFQSLRIVRAWSRRIGDAGTFGQSSLLLAESEEARGDKLSALKAVLEGREAMRASPDTTPEPMDRALVQLRAEWGPEVFDTLMRKLTEPVTQGPAEA